MAVVEKDKNTQILYKVQTGTSAGDNSPTYSTLAPFPTFPQMLQHRTLWSLGRLWARLWKHAINKHAKSYAVINCGSNFLAE